MKETQKELKQYEAEKEASSSIEKWEATAPAWKGKTTEEDLAKNRKRIDANIEYWKGLVEWNSKHHVLW